MRNLFPYVLVKRKIRLLKGASRTIKKTNFFTKLSSSELYSGRASKHFLFGGMLTDMMRTILLKKIFITSKDMFVNVFTQKRQTCVIVQNCEIFFTVKKCVFWSDATTSSPIHFTQTFFYISNNNMYNTKHFLFRITLFSTQKIDPKMELLIPVITGLPCKYRASIDEGV